MKNVAAFAMLLFWMALGSAQTITTFPRNTAPTVVPQGSAPDMRAIVNGSTDSGVTFTTTGGTLMGTANCVQSPCDIALYSATQGGPYTVTATSHANPAVSTTQQFTFGPSPTPLTTHPRFMITSATLAALQARATVNNVAFASMRASAISYWNKDNAIWSWSCNGGNGQPSSDQSQNFRENDALLFAIMALLDKIPGDSSYQWGCSGRDVWTTVEGYVINGSLPVSHGNEFSQAAFQFSLTTDYLIAVGALSPSDLTLNHQFFAYFLQQILYYNTYGSTGGYNNWNSSLQFNSGSVFDLESMRAMGNNYTYSKLMELVAMSLTFNDDTTDDPPLSNTCSATRYQVCQDFTAGSLHAYYYFFAGAALLREYAHWTEPHIVQQVLNQAFPSGGFGSIIKCLWQDGSGPYTCWGDGRGGESSEGASYWSHTYAGKYAMLFAYTAGWQDPIKFGPQMTLEDSSWWDMLIVSEGQFLTFFAANGQPQSPGYTFLTTGDTDDYVTFPTYLVNISGMMTDDTLKGRTDRLNSEKWLIQNTAFGGPLGNQGNCSSHCGLNSEMSNDYASVIAFDWFLSNSADNPTATLAPDPRPSWPTVIFDGSYNNHLTVRSGWTPADYGVSIMGANALIDHEHAYQGGFAIWQNAEYITKGRVEFASNYNDTMSAAMFQNTPSYLNLGATISNSCVGNQQGPAILYGGQFFHAYQNSPPVFAKYSETPTYATYSVVDTPLYNGCPYAGTVFNDVTYASREMLVIRGSNELITYDRGTSGQAANKSYSLTTTGAVTVSGHSATWPTRSGTQQARFTSVLPAGVSPQMVPLITYTAVSGPYAALAQGTSMQMSCLAYNGDGTTTDVTNNPLVGWSTDDSSLSITPQGLVTAVGAVGHGGDVWCGMYQIYSYGYVTIDTTSYGTFSNKSLQNQLYDPEPMAQVEVYAGSLTDTRFLGTLDWGASSRGRGGKRQKAYTPATATLVQSSAGQAYDGVMFGNSLAMFMHTPTAFTGTTFNVPSAATVYVFDLAPATSYGLTGTTRKGARAGAVSCTTDSAGVCSFPMTTAGTVTVGAAGPPIQTTVNTNAIGGKLNGVVVH